MHERLVLPGFMLATVFLGCYGATLPLGDAEERAPSGERSGGPVADEDADSGTTHQAGSSSSFSSCRDNSVPKSQAPASTSGGVSERMAGGKSVADLCDGGCSPVQPACMVVTLDGSGCTIQRGAGTGLVMNRHGNGWSVSATSITCGMILDISGLDDQTYPNSAPTTPLGEASIELYTSERSEDGYPGSIDSLYSSDAPGATVLVESGPVNGSPRTIKGHAHVIAPTGESHDVTYELVF